LMEKSKGEIKAAISGSADHFRRRNACCSQNGEGKGKAAHPHSHLKKGVRSTSFLKTEETRDQGGTTTAPRGFVSLERSDKVKGVNWGQRPPYAFANSVRARKVMGARRSGEKKKLAADRHPDHEKKGRQIIIKSTASTGSKC